MSRLINKILMILIMFFISITNFLSQEKHLDIVNTNFYIGNYSSKDSLITKEELLKELKIKVLNFSGIELEVSRMDVAFVVDGRVEDGGRADSGEFSLRVENIITRMEPGDKIYFESIRAINEDGDEVIVGSFDFKIK